MSRVYRFFAAELNNEDLEMDVCLSPRCEQKIFNQLVRVLRVKNCDKVILVGDGGLEFEFETISAHNKIIELRFMSKKKNENELGFKLGLIVCLPNKPDKLTMILQKAVELGASDLILVNGAFSQMKHDLKEERLLRIMKEAAEQSERAMIPRLMIKKKLIVLLESDWCAKKYKNIFVAMEREDGKGLYRVLKGDSENDGGENKSIYILVGPEGGFSEDEKRLIKQKGLKTYSLGKRILRMETAAIVSLGIAVCGNN